MVSRDILFQKQFQIKVPYLYQKNKEGLTIMRKLTDADNGSCLTEAIQDVNQFRKFKVTITEKLQKIVAVEAETSDEAEQIVSDDWRAVKHVLGSEDFIEVKFKAVPVDY